MAAVESGKGYDDQALMTSVISLLIAAGTGYLLLLISKSLGMTEELGGSAGPMLAPFSGLGFIQRNVEGVLANRAHGTRTLVLRPWYLAGLIAGVQMAAAAWGMIFLIAFGAGFQQGALEEEWRRLQQVPDTMTIPPADSTTPPVESSSPPTTSSTAPVPGPTQISAAAATPRTISSIIRPSASLLDAGAQAELSASQASETVNLTERVMQRTWRSFRSEPAVRKSAPAPAIGPDGLPTATPKPAEPPPPTIGPDGLPVATPVPGEPPPPTIGSDGLPVTTPDVAEQEKAARANAVAMIAIGSGAGWSFFFAFALYLGASLYGTSRSWSVLALVVALTAFAVGTVFFSPWNLGSVPGRVCWSITVALTVIGMPIGLVIGRIRNLRLVHAIQVVARRLNSAQRQQALDAISAIGNQ